MGNIMTCDAWGPHQRVAFARRNLPELRDVRRDEWRPAGHIGLVHTVFPHVSVAGNGGTRDDGQPAHRRARPRTGRARSRPT